MSRETNWRQGSLVKAEEIDRLDLGLVGFTGHMMLISHDCDVPAEKEPVLEFIACSEVEPNTQYLNCRNVRVLHLPFSLDGRGVHLEVSFSRRFIVSREVFGLLGEPAEAAVLGEEDKRVLKQWLATRYGRPAYPNAFEERLRTKVGKRSVDQHIGKLLEPCHKSLCGVFVSLGENRNTELADGDPYGVVITLVYYASGGAEAREACAAAAARIVTLFEQAYGALDKATAIALEACEAVADIHFSLADVMKSDQWRVEWISLEDDGEFLAVGAA